MTFTVKHRASDTEGNVETIYSAEIVEVVPPGPAHNVACGTSDQAHQASNWDEAGIFLDREPPSAPTPGSPSSPRFSKHIILFGGEHTSSALARCGGKVWVMNEAGATVATYEL